MRSQVAIRRFRICCCVLSFIMSLLVWVERRHILAVATAEAIVVIAYMIMFAHANLEMRLLAKRRLPTPVFHYIDGGADDELTLVRNTSAFDDYELLPSQLSDVSSIDTKSTLFGQQVDWPVMIAPTGASKLFHGAGEPAVIRAADKFGMVYSLSTLGTTTIADAAAVADVPKMYQVYIFKDRALTSEFIERCNREWLIQRHGHRTPTYVRQALTTKAA